MGFYLSGHPLDAYGSALKRLGASTYAALVEDRRRGGFKAVLAGTLIKKSERRGRNDQMYAFVSFSDPTGMFEVMLFPEVLVASRPLLEAGKSVLLITAAPTGTRRAQAARRLDPRSRPGRGGRGRGPAHLSGGHPPPERHRGPAAPGGQGPRHPGGARRRRPGSRNPAQRPPAGHSRHPQRDQIAAGSGGGGDVVETTWHGCKIR